MALQRDIQGNGLMVVSVYALAIAASGDNPIIDATDQEDATPFVGAANVLALFAVAVTNTSAVSTVVRILSSGGDLIWAATLAAGESVAYAIPVELDQGLGLKVNLGAANAHYVCAQYWVRAA